MKPSGSKVLLVVGCLVFVAISAYGAVRLVDARRQAKPPGATQSTGTAPEEGSVSRHGDDRSTGRPDGTGIRTCDEEADGNPVKGVYDFDETSPSGDGAIEDLDGAGGGCAEIDVSGVIVRHRTCERNLLAWDCGNWVNNVDPPP